MRCLKVKLRKCPRREGWAVPNATEYEECESLEMLSVSRSLDVIIVICFRQVVGIEAYLSGRVRER